MKCVQKGLKKYDYNIDMEKKDLKKLSKGQLIKLLLKKVGNHEDLLDNDPFKDEVAQESTKPTPPPRTGKWEKLKPKPARRVPTVKDIIGSLCYKPKKPNRKPPPVPEIKVLDKALKKHVRSYSIKIVNEHIPMAQYMTSKPLMVSKLKEVLKELRGFKFIETMAITFKAIIPDKNGVNNLVKYKTAYFNSHATAVTNDGDIEPGLEKAFKRIDNLVDSWTSEGSSWIIDKIDNHYLNIVKYKPLSGSSYIPSPANLRNPKKNS